MNKATYEESKRVAHAAQQEKASANAELRHKLGLSPGDQIKTGKLDTNRNRLRRTGSRSSIGRGRRKRAAYQLAKANLANGSAAQDRRIAQEKRYRTWLGRAIERAQREETRRQRDFDGTRA
jgi:hypothetical protein